MDYLLIYSWIFCLFSSITCMQKLSSLTFNNFMMTGPKAHLSLAESVAIGAETGIQECHYQFQWDRWNCERYAVKIIKPDDFSLMPSNRETAFLQAINSAGITYTVTKNCSLGGFEECGCDATENKRTVDSTWKWGGCGDNTKFGMRVSKLFLDAVEKGKDAKAVVHLHNIEAGRQGVRKTLSVICKCHGVSGSCSMKTCWQQLSDFRNVGTFLKRKYNRAAKVEYQNGALQHISSNTNYHQRAVQVKKSNLVYLEQSSDYCYTNGSHATLNRQCSRPRKGHLSAPWERKSCRRLCSDCGLRVSKKSIIEETSCNCKFHWCCQVSCETCVKEQSVYTCTF